VGVLINHDNKLLLAQRPAKKTWSGWWEFPGGKIERGETPIQALKRELNEEIGVTVSSAEKWIVREYSYDEIDVKLHFFKVIDWAGQIQPQEEQLLEWNNAFSPHVNPILPANELIFKAIGLPDLYAITNAQEHPHDFIDLVENKLKEGLKLIQVREKSMQHKAYIDMTKAIIQMASPYNARVMLNSDTELAYMLGADGVHLNSEQLHTVSEKPINLIVSASCHNKKDINEAIRKQLDFIVLSPINKTPSHPEIDGMGWNWLGELLKKHNMPVYALGGMKRTDINKAFDNGAIGVASQRSVWLD
jgi:8-oxo-dGTP diphosphatase